MKFLIAAAFMFAVVLSAAPVSAGTLGDVITPSACLLTESDRPAPLAGRPKYALDVTVDLANNRVIGTSSVVFTPDLVTDRVVFRLWPNGPRAGNAGAELVVSSVTLDGVGASGRSTSPTVFEIPLAAPLQPGQSVTVGLMWQLALPGAVNDRVARIGDTVRLGSFHPYLAWEPGVGWAEDPATQGFAEASLNVTSDFAVTVNVPEGSEVLASGVLDAAGVYQAPAVADFALSVGSFDTVTGTALSGGVPVQVSVGVSVGLGDNPQAYFDRIASSLDLFGTLYGVYPYPSLTFAITPDLGGGIEYPMHVMQGPGTTGRTTPHEVAHQWFFALVTNNQGRDPWLDEGIASYAEFRHEDELGDIAFRPIPAGVQGKTGQPMTYWDARLSAYYRGVYVQGAKAIGTLGRPRHVDCAVRAYAILLSNRVATNASAIGVFTDVFPWAPAHFASYGIPPG